jgi:hypothetical protein
MDRLPISLMVADAVGLVSLVALLVAGLYLPAIL